MDKLTNDLSKNCWQDCEEYNPDKPCCDPQTGPVIRYTSVPIFRVNTVNEMPDHSAKSQTVSVYILLQTLSVNNRKPQPK